MDRIRRGADVRGEDCQIIIKIGGGGSVISHTVQIIRPAKLLKHNADNSVSGIETKNL